MAEVKEILSAANICPVFQRMPFTRGWLYFRAQEIAEELRRGAVKPFDEVMWHYGDPHAFGQSPITFLRQLLKVLICPDLLEDPRFPQDVKEKAKRILQATPGFDIASYTNTLGMGIIRQDVAHYISQRDGYPAESEFIILTQGGAQGIQVGLQAIGTNYKESEKRTGLMVPIPTFSHYLARSLEYNFYQIHYYLDEDDNWALNIKELKRALDEARPHCEPRALVLINPGNPAGQTLTYDQIRDVITFCAREKLILFADEVYQETVFTEELRFHSCRKVLRDMGPEYKKFQLMSIHSASKGFYGECGLRGGYLELVGFSKEVIDQFRKKLSPITCPTVIGQAAVEAICNPPQPGDESYETFIKEKMAILNSYQRKAKLTSSVLNSMEGVKCTEITGSLYAFPRLFLPRKAIEAAKLKNLPPEDLYCLELLEETGIFVLPGGNFGKKAGSYYFRITILPSEEKIGPMFEGMKRFHERFMDKYRDEPEKPSPD